MPASLRQHLLSLLAMSAALTWPLMVHAADDEPAIEPAPPPAAESTDQVNDTDNATSPARTLELGEPTQPVTPRQSDVQAIPQRVGLPAAAVDIDPAVIGVAPGQPMPTLLREGQFVVNRFGHLHRVQGILLMVFEPRPGQDKPDPPMILQACTDLEIVENLINQRGVDTLLKVSGQVYAYRGFNYLMPSLLEPAAPGDEKTATPASPQPDAENTATEGESTPPATPPVVESESTPAPSEDELMQQLLALRQPNATAAAEGQSAESQQPRDPSKPLIEALADLESTTAAVTVDPALMGIAPNQELPPLKREGDIVDQRRGRLVRASESKALLFVFDADSPAAAELPLVVQPCRLREAMEDLVNKRGNSVVFIVSGQVHTYRGANYLLPTMMKLAVDKGNLLN